MDIKPEDLIANVYEVQYNKVKAVHVDLFNLMYKMGGLVLQFIHFSIHPFQGLKKLIGTIGLKIGFARFKDAFLS